MSPIRTDGRTNKRQANIGLLSFWSVNRWVSQFEILVVQFNTLPSCEHANSDRGLQIRKYDELRDHVESLFGSVPENLTLHRMKKYFFCFYHLVEKIRSFPTMYNTWGCLWGQIDETKHFLQKSGLKTPILAATVLDHPTSKRAETHNFWGIVKFHKCFEKSGT